MRLPLAVAVVVVSGLALPSAQQLPDLPVHVVRIDAIASDTRDEIVSNLKAADFALREDGIPRTIETAQFRLAAPRVFAVFLDEYHVTAGAGAARAREALTRFLDEDLGPDDLVAVMKPLDSLFTIRPTRDHAVARQAIASFEGRKGDYTPHGDYEKNFIAGSAARVEAARVQVTISAINALAVELGRLGDGRKTVIVFSETLGPTTRSARLHPSSVRGREYLATVETVIHSANAASVSIYAINPSATSPMLAPPLSQATSVAAEHGEPLEALTAIAEATDGAALAGSDVGAALRRVARDSRGYYVLTYRSGHKEDGQFHPVQASVTRPGVQLRARVGYWAPSPDDALRALVMARASAPPPVARVEPAPHVSPLIRPWFGLSRGAEGKTRVTFVWEPASRVTGDRRRHVPARIVLTALGADDNVVFQGPVWPNGATVAEERAGALARVVFDAPRGVVRLRMQIEDEATHVIDSDVRNLAVRDWRVAVALGTPEVLRSRSEREFRALAADPAAAPVASREFSRAERLLVRFFAYAPQGADTFVTARLLGRSGQQMRELAVDAGSIPDGRNQLDVPLAGLAPGEYSIQLDVKSSAGQATDRLDFRVTN